MVVIRMQLQSRDCESRLAPRLSRSPRELGPGLPRNWALTVAAFASELGSDRTSEPWLVGLQGYRASEP
eukprot:9668780-Alexandrium_andersonii.AAC.1